jgi:hypothetical protein
MVPIGIVTRDRPLYLDVTLRSLAATELPSDISLTVFDDCSASAAASTYYTTNRVVEVEPDWPVTCRHWTRLGLNVVNDGWKPPRGINGLIDVVSLGKQSLGVFNGSCQAVHLLFERHPEAEGVFLLQDDVIFNPNWYVRMLDTAARIAEYSAHPLGLLAGLKLNHKLDFDERPPIAVLSGITAQCLYIPRSTYQLCNDFFITRHDKDRRFDDMLRRRVMANNPQLWAGCVYPYVCQHIGITSIVRPGKKWTFATSGRVGYYAYPPYSLSSEIRKFKGCRQCE